MSQVRPRASDPRTQTPLASWPLSSYEETPVPFTQLGNQDSREVDGGAGRRREGKPPRCKCPLFLAPLAQDGEAQGVTGQSDRPGGGRAGPAGAKNFW